MANNKNNNLIFKKWGKKANTTFVFVTIIISILSFFVIFSNYVQIGNVISSNANDLTCRAYLNMKDSKAGDIAEMLHVVNLKCKKDEIVIKSNDKNTILKDVADETKRCWYRYGSGESDFMSSYGKTGSWCFTCGTIEFKNDGTSSYSINDFINWADNNKVRLSNGSNVEYSKTFNMKYSVVNDDDLTDIKNNIEDLSNDEGLKDLTSIFSEEYEFLQDLRNKKIDTNSKAKTYVVYRYDKTNTSGKFANAVDGAVIGVAGNFALQIFVEQVLWTVGTAAVCTGSSVLTGATIGAASPTLTLCALMGGETAASYAEGGVKIAKGTKKIMKLSEKIATLIKSTKSIYKLRNPLKFFTGKTDNILAIAGKVKDVNIASQLRNIHTSLKSMNIENINEISVEILNNENKLKNIQKITLDAINSNMLNNPAITKLATKESQYADEIVELKKIENSLKNLNYNDLKKTENVEKTKQYLIGVTYVAAGLIGEDIGSNFNFNSNQYVDIMTQEQYYRLCGTEPNLK